MRGSCSCSGGEQVQGALFGEEGLGVEVLVRAWRDGIEYARVGECGECEGDALPDAVAGLGVGVDHRGQ